MILNGLPEADAPADEGEVRARGTAVEAGSARGASAVGRRVRGAAVRRQLTVARLARGCEAEALGFLSARPVHTVIMSSLIREHGLESPHHRGEFYGCRDGAGRLEGVALVGHATTFEARNDAAVVALARAARRLPRPHVIVGERAQADAFWAAYSRGRALPHRAKHEILLEQRRPAPTLDAVAGLRRARLDDAPLVAAAHAALAERQSGVNPLATDPAGFAARTARRIEAGRVWVWVNEDGRLVFKADVVAETPEAVYLEGVYVSPEERGRGYGLRCFTQLSRELLARAARVCLLVSADNTRAQQFYRRAGYRFLGDYETIFLGSHEVKHTLLSAKLLTCKG